MIKAIYVHPAHGVEERRISEETQAQLHDLQTAVEGYIEAVRLVNAEGAYVATMWVNEEYRLGQFTLDDINVIACRLAGFYGRPDLNRAPGFILGPVIITGPNTPDGFETDVLDEVVTTIASLKRLA